MNVVVATIAQRNIAPALPFRLISTLSLSHSEAREMSEMWFNGIPRRIAAIAAEIDRLRRDPGVCNGRPAENARRNHQAAEVFG